VDISARIGAALPGAERASLRKTRGFRARAAKLELGIVAAFPLERRKRHAKFAQDLPNELRDFFDVDFAPINIDRGRVLWMSAIVAHRNFDLMIELEERTFEKIEIIMSAFDDGPFSNDLLDRKANNRLWYYIDTETFDRLNHETAPSTSYGCPLTNLDNGIAA
jgi:hypothetical protein